MITGVQNHRKVISKNIDELKDIPIQLQEKISESSSSDNEEEWFEKSDLTRIDKNRIVADNIAFNILQDTANRLK